MTFSCFRTSAALGFAQYTPVDKKLYSPEELFDRMCMALGGRAAEAMTFNRVTTGAQNDLDKVTKMAYAQIKNYGYDIKDLVTMCVFLRLLFGVSRFNEEVGLVSFEESDGATVQPYSQKLQTTMDLEAR